jgi:hypothetical protein
MKSRRSISATHFLKVGFLAGACSFAVGCSKEANFGKRSKDAKEAEWDEPLTPSDSAGTEKRVYALLGGYLSCKNDEKNAATTVGSRMSLILSDLATVLKNTGKDDPISLVSCYSWDATNITYAMSSDPSKIVTSTVDEMIATFNGLLDSVEKPKLYIVGHSYGGWTSMKIATNLTANAKMAALITVDPISKENCTPNTIINYVNSQPDSRCKEPPADFGPEKIDEIARRTDLWLNVYQTDFAALHSGPISAAQNLLKTYPTSNFSHSTVIDDPDIRDNIKNVLTAD